MGEQRRQHGDGCVAEGEGVRWHVDIETSRTAGPPWREETTEEGWPAAAAEDAAAAEAAAAEAAATRATAARGAAEAPAELPLAVAIGAEAQSTDGRQ